jgi:hypothetical protein
MFQRIHNAIYYVVDLKEFPPPMPITDGGDPALTQYAEALTNAINNGIVTEPGKYGIQVNSIFQTFGIYKIQE